MSSGFTSSQQKQTQSTTLPQAGQMENALYDQLRGLSNQQAGTLTQQNALQRAMLNPRQTLLDLQQPWQGRTQADSQAHMTKVMGQDFMDRFNAGGGVGAGVTPEEFRKYQGEAALWQQDPFENLRSEDVRMKLQQQIAQNQAAQQV